MVRFLCLGLFTLAAGVPGTAGGPLPLPDSISGWQAEGPEDVFTGDELFLYINGGAEIYREYGFEQVAVRDYARGEDTIAVEVYTMSGDAYGIFSLLRSANDEPVNLGDGGAMSDYYARFWVGSHLVVVTAHGKTENTRGDVLEIARYLVGRYPGGGERPALVSELPAEHRISDSETYVTGPLGMRKVSPLVSRLFRAEAAAARYEIPGKGAGSIFVLNWPDRDSAVAAMEKAFNLAADGPGTGVNRTAKDGFELALPDGKALVAVRQGSSILVGVSEEGTSSARALSKLASKGTQGRVKERSP